MDSIEALSRAYEQIRDAGTAAVAGLEVDALTWRADPEANTIGWLMWHLARVQDDHVAEIARQEQVWVAGEWPARVGREPGDLGIGYGDTAEQVAALRPESPAVLAAYLNEVTDRTLAYLRGTDSADLDRIVDRRFDPPVSAGVRLLSVIGDCLQHVGQAAYLRGLWERTQAQ